MLTAPLWALAAGCDSGELWDPGLSRGREDSLALGQFVPPRSEADTVGKLDAIARRGTPGFEQLVTYEDEDVVFKDEEGTGADRLMTPRLRDRLRSLTIRVGERWRGLSVRVTEAWDEDGEHGSTSLHYEGRAADLTTSDLDRKKLGVLGHFAVEAGFDWVFYEDASHVHVSVRRDADTDVRRSGRD